MKLQDQITLVVNDVSDLIRSAVELNDLYLELPRLINFEHSAISARDFSKVETIQKEKIKISNKIEDSFALHREILQRLGGFLRAITGKEEFEMNVSSSVKILDEVIAFILGRPEFEVELKVGHFAERKYLDSSLGNVTALPLALSVLKERRLTLIDVLDKFRLSFDRVQPEIEKNRAVIRTMIESQQENYRFWTGIAKEESSSYDASGKRNSSPKVHNALLNIRA